MHVHTLAQRKSVRARLRNGSKSITHRRLTGSTGISARFESPSSQPLVRIYRYACARFSRVLTQPCKSCLASRRATAARKATPLKSACKRARPSSQQHASRNYVAYQKVRHQNSIGIRRRGCHPSAVETRTRQPSAENRVALQSRGRQRRAGTWTCATAGRSREPDGDRRESVSYTHLTLPTTPYV